MKNPSKGKKAALGLLAIMLMVFGGISGALADIIIDNGDPGTSYSGGAWGYSSGANPYNGSSQAENRDGATYTFQAAVTGGQTVSLWWTYWSSRCTAVPVDIYDGSQLLATVTVNQQQIDLAGRWNVLGTYTFSGTARVVIRARSGCSANADAVRLTSVAGAEIDHVRIEGPLSVTENTNAQYALRAYYADGTNQAVAADAWEVSCPAYAGISGAGLLSANAVGTDVDCTITAYYDDGGSFLTDTHHILIKGDIAPSEVIVDNDGPGTSYAGGGWGYSSGANPYNGSSRAESTSGATYTFQAAVKGGQTVSLWWTYWSSRCTAVPVDIYDGSQLLATVSVNQQQIDLAGRWNVLGTYAFSGTARVVIRAKSGCSANADAVRFAPAGEAPSEVIVDNDDPGTSYAGGGWGYSSGANPYNGSSRAESTSGATYTFQAAVSEFQTVSLWWTYWPSRCTAVPVDIYDGSQLLATVTVNQQQIDLAGRWNVLGTYLFSGTARVVIRAKSGCSANADAVRFVKAEESQVDYVAIEGPLEIIGNTSAQYTLLAYYANDVERLVEADSWQVSCPAYAEISDSGLLSAFDVIGDQNCTITASYDDGSTLHLDTLSILVQDSTAPAEVIVDNDRPGTSYSGGGWGYSSGADPYNGSSRAESSDGATYTFQASLTGYYTISLWWTYWPSRCDSVSVSIFRDNQFLSTVSVNQQQVSLAGQWNGIGAFAFSGTARVVVRAQSGCSSCADAVRFQLQGGIDNYYVAIGDSITDGVGDDDPFDDISMDGRNSAGGFEPILNDLLTSMTGESHTVVNEGVGGATSSNGLSSISAILAAHPESTQFLVQYGTNDANPFFPIPSGKGLSPGDAGYPGSFKDNMQQMIDVLNMNGREVCLAKIPITLGSSASGPRYSDPDTGVRSVLIKEYNEVVDELHNNPLNNITVTPPDFYSLFNEDVTGGKRYDFEFADNLHPNGEGYRSMADLWFEALTP